MIILNLKSFYVVNGITENMQKVSLLYRVATTELSACLSLDESIEL